MARYLDAPWRWRQIAEPKLSIIVYNQDRVHILCDLIETGEPGDVVKVHPSRVDFWLTLPDYVTLRTYPDGEEITKRLTPWDWACKLRGIPSQYKKKEPSKKSKFYLPWMEAQAMKATVGAAQRAQAQRHTTTVDEPIPFDEMRKAKRLALDSETDTKKGDKPRPTHDPILGISVGWETGECWISAEQLKDVDVFSQLVEILCEGDRTLVGHHAKFDEIIMHRLGFCDFEFTDDTMLKSYVHGGKYPAGLKPLTQQLLGRSAQELGPLMSRYGSVGQVPKATLIPYAKADARNTYDCDTALDKLGTDPLYSELEMPMSHLLTHMEEEGWRVDNDRLAAVEKKLKEQMEEAEEELAPFGIMYPTKNQEVAEFFMSEGFILPKTQTGWGVDKDVLAGINHPAAPILLDYREAHKRLTNWCRAMRETQDKVRGHIHPNFRQAPASGRLSCSNPNVQNYTYDLRSCLVPDPGHVLIAADMSQFEMRLTAKASGDPTLLAEYLANVDIHTLNQTTLHLPTRRAAKDTMYGVNYGQGEVALSDGLTKKGEFTTIPEARMFIASIYGKYKRLKPWKKEVLAYCRTHDCTSETMMGRKRWLPELNFDDPTARGHAERAAVNHVIQGTAGDLMKMGQLMLEEVLPQHGARQLAQIHDEFVISTPNPFATYDALMVVLKEFQRWLDPVPISIDVMVDYHWGMKG